MVITFKYKKKKYSYELKNNIIKIYEVPKDYSSDGLYIADYSNTSLEPYPSSDSSNTKLLYHASVKKVMKSYYIDTITNKLGDVEYA
jgi:hypothetical protein